MNCTLHDRAMYPLDGVWYCKECEDSQKEFSIIPYIVLVWGLGHLVWLFLYMNPFS